MSQESNQESQVSQKLFITTEEIINATLTYLASKPYSEVSKLVEALMQSKPYSPEPPVGPSNEEEVKTRKAPLKKLKK